MRLQVYPWQTRQWDRIMSACDSNRLPHAMLFTGPSGTGIEHFSRVLSASLLCENPDNHVACGECRSCRLFLSGNHPDVYYVEPDEPGKQIKVDNIRSFIEFTQLTSQYTHNKIAIINPADDMNRNAANALLKTLEEPSGSVVMILVSSRPSKLVVTIRSRCQRVQFNAVEREMGMDWIRENNSTNAMSLDRIWTIAQGKPLHALDLLESGLGEQHSRVLADLKLLLNRSTDLMQVSQQWQELGAEVVFNWLINLIAMMTRIKLAGDPEKYPTENFRDLQHIVNQLNLYQLVCSFDLAVRQYQAATGLLNLNQTGLLEEFILFWQGQCQQPEDNK